MSLDNFTDTQSYHGREVHHRVNIQPQDNYTITYQQRRTWNFVEELSNGTLKDNVTTLNVPLVVKLFVNIFVRKYQSTNWI